MKGYATLFTLAALALAGCQDVTPTGPAASASPLTNRGGGADAAFGPGNTSTRGVVPLAFEGNTGRDASGLCSSYGGTLSFKVDGANDKTGLYGYNFDVSGDGRTLSYTQTAPGHAVVAVLVKGGPAYSVYDYGPQADGSVKGPYPSDGNLSSPDNRGGNVPTISHYVVCATPAPPVVTKKFIAAFGDDMQELKAEPMLSPEGQVVPMYSFPTTGSQAIWLQYEISYSNLAPGTKITEEIESACSEFTTYFPTDPRPNSSFTCSTDGFDGNGLRTTTVSGSGKFVIHADIFRKGGCGDRPFQNRLTITPPTGQPYQVVADRVWTWSPHC
jgi:hypothetical protein